MKVLSAPLRCKAKELSISIDHLKTVFTYKDGKLFNSKGKRVGSYHHTGYRWISFKGNRIAEGRLVWALHYNRWPNGVVDHINGIEDDNRIENLRDVDERTNTLNTIKVRNKGHFPGVCFRDDPKRAKPWRAFAPAKFLNRDAPNKRFIKSFKTKEEAIIAVVNFCYFGESFGVLDL
jgi:hypothetical protein